MFFAVLLYVITQFPDMKNVGSSGLSNLETMSLANSNLLIKDKYYEMNSLLLNCSLEVEDK